MKIGKAIYLRRFCGYGKTRKMIPRFIEKARKEGKRMWILAPTRVVAREMYEALQDQGGISFRVRGMTTLTANGPIMITCHETALTMVLKKERLPDYIIVDESHFAQPATIALLKLGEEMAKMGKMGLVALSATNQHGFDEQTNYEVKDLVLTEEEVWDTIDEEEKVIWFVPSQKVAEKMKLVSYQKGIESVVLSRSTYHLNYQKAKSMKKGIIFSTNISEVGANYNVDIVVDSGKQLVPAIGTDPKTVILQMQWETKASQVQRRGRVGRTHEGDYV